MELIRLDNHEKISSAVEKVIVPFTLFGSPQLLNTFFNNKGFELWSAVCDNETYIFVRKVEREHGNNELRLLFTTFPDKLIEQLKKEFDPPYMAYNELPENPQQENQIEDTEVVVDLEKYVGLEHATMRKHYKQAVRDNDIEIRAFKDISTADIQEFWKTWLEQRSDRPFSTDRTHNDAYFFELYSNEQYFGVAAYDRDKLIAYSIGVPFDEHRCISAFNKCLRGYTNLGLQISYQKAVIAAQKGYTHMALGGINNDFKKSFLSIAETVPLYGFEVFRNPDFKTKTPNGYTHALFL